MSSRILCHRSLVLCDFYSLPVERCSQLLDWRCVHITGPLGESLVMKAVENVNDMYLEALNAWSSVQSLKNGYRILQEG